MKLIAIILFIAVTTVLVMISVHHIKKTLNQIEKKYK